MSDFKLLFSDYFDVDKQILEEYGALNICLTADLPLFIDPFLLFASTKTEYQKLHSDVVNHLIFLKEHAIDSNENNVNISLFRFPEIKQNWLGMSKYGNDGKGLGKKFARSAISAFNGFYRNFGDEVITEDSHIEKLTLVKSGVGKDFISDFTTNLIQEYLLVYTEKFAQAHLTKTQRKKFSIRCRFDKKTKTWQPRTFELPYFFRETNGDFILLTPLDILTIDAATINNEDLISSFSNVTRSLENDSLRSSINDFFRLHLPKKPTKDDRIQAIYRTIEKFPELVDYYIKIKEDKKENIGPVTAAKIEELKNKLLDALTPLCQLLNSESDFYKVFPNSYEEALKRAIFLKEVIENNDGYRIFYYNNRPVAKEDTIQRIFRLTWYASPYDVNSEVNNGRGPADYKISFGSGDSAIVEFKLARSSSLKKNLMNQTDIYKAASKSASDISVVLCYNASELRKVNRTLKEIGKEGHENIIIIDASPKKSASKV
tara:strand:- start:1234 stop:2700 length:1467 start_codon:yes stop_codon:yes gene_type:complete